MALQLDFLYEGELRVWVRGVVTEDKTPWARKVSTPLGKKIGGER